MKFHFETSFRSYKDHVVVCDLSVELEPETHEDMVLVNYCPSVETRGVAYCSPEDKFDLKIGKRIAESRASMIAFKKLTKAAKHVREYSVVLMRETNMHLDRLDRLMKKEVEHHKRLVEEV